MILVSRNIRCVRIFVGVPRGWGVKYNTCVHTLNKNVFISYKWVLRVLTSETESRTKVTELIDWFQS